MSKNHTAGTTETPRTSWPRHGLRSWLRWRAAALIFAGAAGAAAWWQVARTERLLRTEFLLHARLAANAFEAGVMAAVPFASGARALPEFQQLHRQMRHLADTFRADWKPARQYLSIYSLRLRDGIIVFGPESIPEHHRHAAPPGTVYTNPPPGLKELFAGGQSLIAGPCPDEYGTFVSAFVPLRDSAGRRSPIILGMDIMANDWRRAILVASAESIILTFVAMVLLLLSVFSVRATRRIHSQQAVLRKSERQFRTLVENTPGITYLCRNNERHAMMYISEQVRQLTGHDRAAFLSHAVSFADLYHPDDAGRIRQQVDEAIQQKTPFHLTYRLRHKDGSWRWAEAWGTALGGGPAQTDVLLEGFITDVTGRIKDEERLLFQSQVLDSVSEAIVVTDLDGIILYWGRGAEVLYGYPAGDVLGRSYRSVAGSVDPVDEGAFRRRILEQGSWSGEHRQRRRDGTFFWSAVFVSVLRDAAGQPIGFIGLDHDITERKQAESRLRKSQIRTSLAMHIARMGYWRYEIATDRVEWSEGHEKLFGIGQEDFAGSLEAVQHCVHPDDRAYGEKNLRDAIANHTPFDNTYRVIYPNGAIHWLHSWGEINFDVVGKPDYVFGITQDITECKQAERALLDEATRRRMLLEQSRDGIVVLDQEGRVHEANRGFSEMLGYAPEELRTLSVFDWEFLFPREHILEMIRTIDAKGDHFETKHRRKDGTVYDVEISTNAAWFAGQKLIFCVCRDITERKCAEAAARRARADQDLIGRMATVAVESQELARFQQELLPLLGTALDVSRVYIFTYRHDQKTMDNTAEWTAPGVTAQMDDLQGIPADTAWWWTASLMHGAAIQFADIADIPDARTMAALRAQGIQAIMVVPLFIGTRYYGFMGLDECRGPRAWTPREQNLLAEAARILMGVWADEDLRHSEQRFKGILQNVATVAVQGYAMDGTVRYWNRAAETFYGYTAEEAIGRNLLDLIVPPAMRDDVRAAIHSMLTTGAVIPASELTLMRKDGALIQVYSSHALVRVPGQNVELFCIDIDLTERKRAEAEQEQLQAQFAQAQKMESVGRLAGGVAHDFNNMLQAILGYTELALERVNPHDPLRGDLTEIRAVAQRSAELTRQLLAFARKQTVAPKVLDLNETVTGMIKMLGRLIGEDITLVWSPGPALWLVKMDPVQLDQILANLCVNARDAIAGVGNVAIATANAVCDEARCAQHPGVVPGEYVRLAVSDNGCGMNDATRAHLFEPFFTTKETGKGTGLGLATVYGVVKQNQGFIDVASAPGHGTTFTIYLPRHAAKTARKTTDHRPAAAAAGGGEIILLVEDEPAILKATTRMLESLGYTVVTAATPGEAIRLAREYPGRIDLLLTDVVMPEMSGRDLAKTLLSIYPDIGRLFMSGYTADAIAHQGVLDEGVHFLQKPFSMKELSAKLREVLTAPA